MLSYAADARTEGSRTRTSTMREIYAPAFTSHVDYAFELGAGTIPTFPDAHPAWEQMWRLSREELELC